MSSLLFHLYILLAILVLYNLYTLIALYLLPVSSVFPTQTLGATPYEFLMFTQQWPIAVNNTSKLTRFTIHGLWPSNYSVQRLHCKGRKFNKAKMIEDLKKPLKNLNDSWPNVKSGNNMWFWEHEYKEHGTCCDGIFSQTQYFKFSHDKWKELDIARMLKERGIFPGSNYNSSEVVAAIKEKTQHRPNIRCIDQNGSAKSLLVEVVVCFDRVGEKVVHCDLNKTNCAESIFYKLE